MAAGIVVRTIGPLLGNKRTDPAVVLLDEKGRHVVSLLSGHLGGANALAAEIARITGGNAVITTASDANDLPAIDLWAHEQGLVIEDWRRLPKIATRLVDQKGLRLFSEVPLKLPEAFLLTEDPADADIIVTNKEERTFKARGDALIVRPRNLVAGIGCNSGAPAGEIANALKETLAGQGLSFLSLRALATIDKKKDEPGLAGFAQETGLDLLAFSPDTLNLVHGVAPSPAALKATGARAVAEPAALLGSGDGELVVRKQRRGNVTVAIAQTPLRSTVSTHSEQRGLIHVVGIGPGSSEHLTPAALKAVRESDVIVGYGPYLSLLREAIADKECVSTGMTREIERCRKAIELSRQGRTVSVISGGDPGIYAMAGLVLELLKQGDPVEVEVIPGISALNACAARLGAPLMHDFATISLSDRLTPWSAIEERLEAAARADFVIVLYNPRSGARSGHIRKAQEIILKHRRPETPAGIVRAAMREGEKVTVSDLAHLPFDEIDMQTTVIIGNSRTIVRDGLMITPRGYENKKNWKTDEKSEAKREAENSDSL